jgi:hypothetical protein
MGDDRRGSRTQDPTLVTIDRGRMSAVANDVRGEGNEHVAGNGRRVVILGDSFAGIGAAQKLKTAAADVVLIDYHGDHTFQPLLCKLATSCSSPAASVAGAAPTHRRSGWIMVIAGDH